jgi:anti-sigma factor RsiW
MTCREFADFLDSYLSGGLPPAVRAAFEHHLQLCINCVRYLEQYRQSIELGRRVFEAPSAEVPAEVPEDLIRGILVAFRLTGC